MDVEEEATICPWMMMKPMWALRNPLEEVGRALTALQTLARFEGSMFLYYRQVVGQRSVLMIGAVDLILETRIYILCAFS